MNQPIIYSYDALKGWFLDNKRSKFTLYSGHSNDAKHSICTQESDEISIEKSWDVLDKFLEYYLYTGDFYLHVTASKNGTGGGKNTPIRLSGKTQQTPQNSAGIAGISGMVTLESVNGLIENALMKKENAELKQRIADGLRPQSGGRLWDLIDNALQDEGSGKEVIGGLSEGIKEVGTGIKYLLMNLSNNTKQQKALTDHDAPRPKKKPETAKNTEGKNYKVDKMFNVFKETESIFPDHEPQKVHAALIEMFNNLGEVERVFMSQQLEKFMQKDGQNA